MYYILSASKLWLELKDCLSTPKNKNCYIFSILENFWIILKNPANPAKIWPEPEPEPDWKIMAGSAGTGTGTGYPVAHWSSKQIIQVYR